MTTRRRHAPHEAIDRRSTIWAVVILLAVVGLMAYLAQYPFRTAVAGSAPMALGFLLLSSWCVALIGERLGLPKLTGYIVAGLCLGPSAAGLISAGQMKEMTLVNDLALTFIALVAGGELEFKQVRRLWRSIAGWIGGQLLVVPLIAGGGLALAGLWLPLGLEGRELIAVAIILGAVSLARSPAATVAVISESESRGPFTETVLATTVTLDTLVVLIFAASVSLGGLIVSPSAGFEIDVLVGLGVDLAVSAVLGISVGLGVIVVIRYFRIDLPVLLAALAFLITRLSHESSALLATRFEIHMHLEPLLMGLAAGVVVQNFSRRGAAFTEALERIAPPIYVAFFSLAGAALDARALLVTWPLALLLVVLRTGGLWVGSWTGSLLARDPPQWRRIAGWTAVSQAGVSLGLAAEIGRRFPEWSGSVVAPLVAAIAVNQIVGPVLLERMLTRVGETAAAADSKSGAARGSSQEVSEAAGATGGPGAG